MKTQDVAKNIVNRYWGEYGREVAKNSKWLMRAYYFCDKVASVCLSTKAAVGVAATLIVGAQFGAGLLFGAVLFGGLIGGAIIGLNSISLRFRIESKIEKSMTRDLEGQKLALRYQSEVVDRKLQPTPEDIEEAKLLKDLLRQKSEKLRADIRDAMALKKEVNIPHIRLKHTRAKPLQNPQN